MGAKSDSDVERALRAFGDLTLKYRSFGAIPLRLGQSLLMGADPRVGDFADMPLGPAADLPPTNAADAFPLLGSALSEARDVPVAAKYAPSAAAERWGGAAPAAPAPRMNLAAQALARGRRTDPAVQGMPDTAALEASRAAWPTEPEPLAAPADSGAADAMPAARAVEEPIALRSAETGPVVIRPSTDPGYEPPGIGYPQPDAASIQAPDVQPGSFASYAAPQSYPAAAFAGQQAPSPYAEPAAPAAGPATVDPIRPPAAPAAARPDGAARLAPARTVLARGEPSRARPPLAGLFHALGQGQTGTPPDARPPSGPDRSAS